MTQDEFQDKVIEKLTRLETHMEGLIGNGQPGRIDKLEARVDTLDDRWKWTAGLVTGVSGTISAVIHFVFKH